MGSVTVELITGQRNHIDYSTDYNYLAIGQCCLPSGLNFAMNDNYFGIMQNW
jgi:hypothetical protein